VSKLIICYLLGERTLDDCRRFIQDLASRLNSKPLFTSDALDHYADALLEAYSTVLTPQPTGKRGRPRKPCQMIDPDLDYAIVRKLREGGRVVKVEYHIRYGDPQRIAAKRAKSRGEKTNTAYVERSNGTLRQRDSHLRRKSLCFAKVKQFMGARLAIVIAYYNFVKPHGTLSRNADRTTTPRTPAQAAGITYAPWSVEYLLARPELSQ
jgi:IS1 family transposase